MHLVLIVFSVTRVNRGAGQTWREERTGGDGRARGQCGGCLHAGGFVEYVGTAPGVGKWYGSWQKYGNERVGSPNVEDALTGTPESWPSAGCQGWVVPPRGTVGMPRDRRKARSSAVRHSAPG